MGLQDYIDAILGGLGRVHRFFRQCQVGCSQNNWQAVMLVITVTIARVLERTLGSESPCLSTFVVCLETFRSLPLIFKVPTVEFDVLQSQSQFSMLCVESTQHSQREVRSGENSCLMAFTDSHGRRFASVLVFWRLCTVRGLHKGVCLCAICKPFDINCFTVPAVSLLAGTDKSDQFISESWPNYCGVFSWHVPGFSTVKMMFFMCSVVVLW